MARQPPGVEVDALIGQYQHLTNHSRGNDALFTIRKIGSMVKPIMRQRGWRVGTLAEFYPEQPNLLGLNHNHGEKIQLRLRYPGDREQFMPFEDVLDTMLHELCHNAIGPHNAQFNALWDQLRDEMQSLIRKGYTGEGFLGRGQQLGGRRLPLHEASRLARQAAEQRRKAAERARGSGQRLGGTGILPGQDPRAVIANAVERRIRIERGCASGTAAGDRIARGTTEKEGQVTTTQAGPEDENEATMMQAYIDLIQEEEREKFGGYYSPPSAENPAGPRGFDSASSETVRKNAKSLVEQQREIEGEILKQKHSSASVPISTNSSALHLPPSTDLIDIDAPPVSTLTKSTPRPPSEPQEPSMTTWTCEICTLINPIAYLSCDACGVERPSSISASLTSSSPDPLQGSASRRKQNSTREVPNALKPRSTAYDSIQRFNAERAAKISNGPIGWTCVGCGNFMEAEWWTCARCGRMKGTS